MEGPGVSGPTSSEFMGRQLSYTQSYSQVVSVHGVPRAANCDGEHWPPNTTTAVAILAAVAYARGLGRVLAAAPVRWPVTSDHRLVRTLPAPYTRPSNASQDVAEARCVSWRASRDRAVSRQASSLVYGVHTAENVLKSWRDQQRAEGRDVRDGEHSHPNRHVSASSAWFGASPPYRNNVCSFCTKQCAAPARFSAHHGGNTAPSFVPGNQSSLRVH